MDGRSSHRCPTGSTATPAFAGACFGPELRRFVLMQYHQGQSTLPRIASFLRSVGVAISKRQLQRLLTSEQESFAAEATDVLRAGLETSPYVSVDETGARHKAKNGFCTQIGNDWFTWFGTRTSKSRLNFLELLRAGHTDYVLNDAAYAYMRKHALAAALIPSLQAQPETTFADQKAWLAHLDRLGFTALDATPDPVRVATEAAVWGSAQSHAFLCDGVILSDDAGQFNVGRHALCWMHAERLVHKLDTFTDKHRAAQQKVRDQIWDFYGDLKAYKLKPRSRQAAALRKRFDRIFQRRTGCVTLDRLLKRLHANKAELLMVLDRPPTPLHTNGSENDIRCYVTRRKLSAGTRSDAGRATAAMPSWASPRPAPSSVSRSGITWATGSRSRDTSPSSPSTFTSGDGSGPREQPPRPRFCPSYAVSLPSSALSGAGSAVRLVGGWFVRGESYAMSALQHTDTVNGTLGANGASVPMPLVRAGLEQVRQTIQLSVGQIVLATMNLPRYRNQTLADLEHLFVAPLLRDRVAIARRTPTNGSAGPEAVAGIALWATVSDAVDAKISAQIKAGVFPVRLATDDWTSGETVWLLDVVAPDRAQATSVLANFRKLAGWRAVKIAPLVTRLIDPAVAAQLPGGIGGEGVRTPVRLRQRFPRSRGTRSARALEGHHTWNGLRDGS